MDREICAHKDFFQVSFSWPVLGCMIRDKSKQSVMFHARTQLGKATMVCGSLWNWFNALLIFVDDHAYLHAKAGARENLA